MTFVFEPLRDLLRNTGDLQKDIETLFNGSLASRTWTPSVEISENGQEYSVEVDLPGLSKEDVKISVEDNILTITGDRKQKKGDESALYHHNERIFGSFRRTFNLSKLIDTSAISAVYENGVLKLELPKAEEAKPRQIDIKIA